MSKRIISLILSAALLLGMGWLLPTTAHAASSLKTSQDAVEVLKNMEGFRKYPYQSGEQYYVGYGTTCPAADLERLQKEGITDEEATDLMSVHLEKTEDALNKFADQNGLTFTQRRFDALMLFSYNVGTAWLKETSDFRTAVLKGTVGNEFIYCMTRWCVSGGAINTDLINRRLAEANLYINGVYGASCPAYYSYVLYDANGGSKTTGIQGYDAADTAKPLVTATRSGYTFLGWFTEKTGGRLITDLDTSTAKKTLYAHWQGPNDQGVASNYQRTVTGATSIYNLNGSGNIAATAQAGQTVTITMDYVDDDGVHWGKTASGWINLAHTAQPLSRASKPDFPQTGIGVNVTVTNSYVNVRSGPGTSYALVGKVYQGDKLLITETTTVNKALWGKFEGGWLSLMYTNYNDVKNSGSGGSSSGNSGSTGAPETIIATGTVVDCNQLRVRSGPGTGYKQVGSLAVGTYVELSQRQTVNGVEWGKIATGWICLTYVQLDEKAPEKEPETEQKPSQGGTATTPNSNSTGTVINCTVLNVRSGPGTHNPKVTTLPRGTKVNIHETTVYRNEPWGRIDQGWVPMGYIQLDYVSNDMGSTGQGTKGTVYNCTKLNVRRAPGTNNTPVGTLYPGAQVTVYEETTVGDMPWGRIDQGWVCMDYILLDKGTASEGVPEDNIEGARTGVVVNTNSLRIRSGAGTHNAQVGTLNMGSIVIVYEQTTVKGAKWGRIDQGWVCMDYIKLDPEDGSFKGTVTMDGLMIHAKPGVIDSGVGTYNQGDVVTILETTSVNGVAWGRTGKGWICLQYVIR